MKNIYICNEKTGENIRRLMEEKHFSINDICMLAEVSKRTVIRWRQGDYIPPIDKLLILAHIFHTPINEIVTYKIIDY